MTRELFMVTGVVFWYGKEVGREYKKKQAFPVEHREAIRHQTDYRYLYNMIKERKGPKETFSALIPNLQTSLHVPEDRREEYLRELDSRLDRSIKAVLQQAVLDSN